LESFGEVGLGADVLRVMLERSAQKRNRAFQHRNRIVPVVQSNHDGAAAPHAKERVFVLGGAGHKRVREAAVEEHARDGRRVVLRDCLAQLIDELRSAREHARQFTAAFPRAHVRPVLLDRRVDPPQRLGVA